jgi:hypothetical protein
MSDMIEQVARALYEQDHAAEKWDESFAKYFAWDGPNFKGQNHFRRIARTAIEAMRELPGEPGPRYTAGEYSRRTQSAMVDDALSVTNGDR